VLPQRHDGDGQADGAEYYGADERHARQGAVERARDVGHRHDGAEDDRDGADHPPASAFGLVAGGGIERPGSHVVGFVRPRARGELAAAVDVLLGCDQPIRAVVGLVVVVLVVGLAIGVVGVAVLDVLLVDPVQAAADRDADQHHSHQPDPDDHPSTPSMIGSVVPPPPPPPAPP